MKKLLVAVLTITAWGVFLLPTANASYSQLIKDTSRTENQSSAVGQTLGSGLSGNLYSVTINMAPGGSGTSDYTLFFTQWTNSNYSGPSVSTTTTISNVLNDEQADFEFVFQSLFPLDPTKYYEFYAQCISSCGGDTKEVWGSSSVGSWSGGQAYSPSTTTALTTVDDLYFRLTTVADYSSNSTQILQVNSPGNGENTLTTTVLFDFDYFFNDSDIGVYDRACVRIYDETIGQNLVPVCDEIAASGGASMVQPVVLTENHFYLWRPSIQNADGTNVILGAFRSFTVVSNPGGFSQLPGDDSQASTTLQGLTGVTHNLFRVFIDKWPFSWVAQTNTLLNELAATTTQYSFDAVEYDPSTINLQVWEQFPNATGTAASMNIPIAWTLFSTSTLHEVSEVQGIQTMRTLLGWILWFGLISMIARHSMSIFEKQA